MIKPVFRIILSITLSATLLTFFQSCNDDDDGQPLPDLMVNVGPDQVICSGESVIIGGNPSAEGGDGSYTYSWSNGAGATSNPEVSPEETTTYTLTVADNSGNAATDELTITVAEVFTVDAGDDRSILTGQNTTIGGDPTASGNGTYTYSWSNGAGAGANPEVSPTMTTTYSLTVTDENGCSQEDQVTVRVASFAVNAGDDQTICLGSSVILGGNPTASGDGSFTYSWSNGATEANPSVSPTATTTYTVTVTNSDGLNQSDDVTITIAEPFTVDAGADQIACQGEMITLGGNPTADGSGTYTYSWDNGAGSAANPEVIVTATTTFSLTVTDENGCTEEDEVTITLNPDFIVDAGTDQTICAGESATLGGSPTASGSGDFTYAWDNGGETDANPEVFPTATTTYTVTVTDGNGCAKTDEVTVTISPDFTVDAGNTQQICQGESITLGGGPTADGPGTYTYSWSDGISEISTDANPTVTPSSATLYTVTVTNENGCIKSSSTEIGITAIPTGSQIFTFTGGPQSFTFPACITELEIEIHGAEGEDGEDLDNLGLNGQGGSGAVVTGVIQLDPVRGNMINIYVGGAGVSGGYNGGGSGGTSANNAGGNGGGATDIRYGGTALIDRIAVAAGGGGGGGSTTATNAVTSGDGGSAGGSNEDGQNATGLSNPLSLAQGGTAGNQIQGGIGGVTGSPNGCQPGAPGIDGTLGSGGIGGSGGLRLPGCTIQGNGGGGAGGGYYGGGGGAGGQGNSVGASFPGAGGGAGSSYIGGITSASIAESTRSGNGYVLISW